MSPIKIAINGFGRIGRVVLRQAISDSRFEVVSVNDPSSIDTLAHLFKYDSVHGTVNEPVHTEGNTLCIGKHKIQCSQQRDPAQVEISKLGATFVHECTGVFTDREKAAMHLKAGAKKVIISAPSKDPDAMIVMGVNHETYDSSKHDVISNASCTTNCLAPVVKVLDDHFGLLRGTMVTIHSYTNDQRILDAGHKDLRRARAGAVSQIPTSTGAAKAVGVVMPHLKGKLDGYAVRVPTPNVSMVDFVAELKNKTTKEDINAAFKKAANENLKGVLGYSTEPLVSCDYNGNKMSSTVDSALTLVMDGNLVKVVSWYDNESGFSARMLDLTEYMAKQL